LPLNHITRLAWRSFTGLQPPAEFGVGPTAFPRSIWPT
jgi:hypothetical protein